MGSDMLQFVIRMALFAVTFYFLAEFALVSNVPTPLAMSVLIAIVAVIIMFTVAHRAKRVVHCPHCKHNHIA
jgi:hypothetical protein